MPCIACIGHMFCHIIDIGIPISMVTCTLYWSHDTPHIFFRYLYWSDTNGVLKVPLATAWNALCSLPTSSSYIVPNLPQPVFTVDLKANLLYYVDLSSIVYTVPINSSTPSPTCVGDAGFTEVVLTTLGSNVMLYVGGLITVCRYLQPVLLLPPTIIQTMHSDLQPLLCKHTVFWGGGGGGGGGDDHTENNVPITPKALQCPGLLPSTLRHHYTLLQQVQFSIHVHVCVYTTLCVCGGDVCTCTCTCMHVYVCMGLIVKDIQCTCMYGVMCVLVYVNTTLYTFMYIAYQQCYSVLI